MQTNLTEGQLLELKEVLVISLYDYELKEKSNCTEVSCKTNINATIVNNFIGTKSLEGKKKSTLKQYLMVIKDLLFFLKNKNICDISSEDIKMYLATYKKLHKINNISLNNRRRYINTFLQWCEENEFVEKNVCKKIKEIKTEQRIKPVITEEQAEIIRDECKNNLKDAAIIELCFSTGLRVSELEIARVSDVNFEKNEIIIHGVKNNQDRIGFLTIRSKLALKKYLFKRGNPEGHEYLFTSSEKRNKKMSKNAFQKIIKHYASVNNIGKVTIHSLRRYFATHLKQKGVPDVYIAQLLGHKSIQTTKNHYIFVSNDTIKQTYMAITA